MDTKFFLKIPLLALLSCQAGPSFKSMTAQELAAYNIDKPIEERVHCYMREHTSSRIPRVVCETLAEIYGRNGDNAMTINNAIPNGQIFDIN